MGDDTMADAMQYKLCYVRRDWAWFCDVEPTEMWGDDWDDAPYEHNACEPYADKHNCACVAWRAPLDEPCEGCFNSSYSVEAINHGVVPWLREWQPDGVKIWAGTTLEEFIKLIASVGGTVYVPLEASHAE